MDQRGETFRRRTLAPILVVIVFFIAALACAATLRESLWVDELHSAWVIRGPWNEVIPRSAAGNQSPFYFAVLKAWSELTQPLVPPPSTNDFYLRLSSWLGWTILCGWLLVTIRRTVPDYTLITVLCIVCGWLALDRIGAFYAIEIRPYMWVAVASLGLLIAASKIPDSPEGFAVGWLVWAIAAFYLHYTAVLVIALNWLGVMTLLGMRWHQWRPLVRRRVVAMRVLEGGVLAAVMLPGLWQLSQVAARADQWSSFASNTRWSTVVDLFPWLFWTVPAIVAAGWTSFFQPNRQENAFQITEARYREWLILLGYVGFGTMIVGWLMTVLQIAPLMHRRYLFGAYPAIVLCSAYYLGMVRDFRWRWVTGFVTILSMIAWQGTIEQWRSGQWIAWQRGEDWRAAVQFLASHALHDQPVFLAPMLIETRGPRIEADAQDDYLRYPLTSQYPLDPRTPIYVLPNDTSHWAESIAGDRSLPFQSVAWIVVRKNLGSSPTLPRFDEYKIAIKSFCFGGNLYILQLEMP